MTVLRDLWQESLDRARMAGAREARGRVLLLLASELERVPSENREAWRMAESLAERIKQMEA